MSTQIQDAYIVAATRTAVGKTPRGAFKNTRPDDLLAHVIPRRWRRHRHRREPHRRRRHRLRHAGGRARHERGAHRRVARGPARQRRRRDHQPLLPSGVQAIAMAADRIRTGDADLMLAGGTESMSMVPMMGHKIAMNPAVFRDENVAIAYGMGITAEKVAEQWKVSREDQVTFALASHQKALAAIAAGEFKAEIAPYTPGRPLPRPRRAPHRGRHARDRHRRGAAQGHQPEGLGKLKPVFRHGRQRHRRQCLADVRWRRCGPAGQRKGHQGIQPDPAGALRLLLGCRRQAGHHGHRSDRGDSLRRSGRQALSKDQLDWIELNEAFAAQALAVIRDNGLDPAKVNPLGGAIALVIRSARPAPFVPPR